MNEAILLGMAALDLALVYFAFRLGLVWLYVSIVINLRLIALLGAKLIVVFGLTTNVGNVFYAAVFFAIYLILEHHSHRDAARAIWIGIVSAVAFLTFTELTMLLMSAPETQSISALMDELLLVVMRISLASLAGFLVASYVNIWFYMFWKERVGDLHWWLRAACVVLAAQLVDSIIFFVIAFVGAVDPATVLETMFAGYLVKVGIGLLAVPLLFWSHSHKRETDVVVVASA